MKIPKAAIRHAIEEYPREACGVIVGRKYYPCRNIATTPSEHFIMSPADYKAALEHGEVRALFHSHPDYPATPSEADRASCEESGVPWLIASIVDGRHVGEEYLEPCGYEAPLIGRAFYHGVHDCLAIILDYYKRERGIDLGKYEREDGWWDNGKDYYRELLPRAGFVQVSGQPQHGDVILMQIRSPVPNHAAIFLADGKLTTEPNHYPAPGCILHHLYGQDSRRDMYGGYWLEKTVGVWRYENGSAVRQTRE